MTKIEAIKRVLEENGGTATWNIIYDNIETYYPAIKSSNKWKSGIRGVLYRELKNRRLFKKIGLGIFALKDYKEEDRNAITTNKIRMHSFIEGICIELGNFDNYYTFTADPSAAYKDNIQLDNITTLKTVPAFTYPEIVNVVERIDVIWFNKKGFIFPKQAFEVVDSIGTLGNALNRTLQLSEFNVNFFIIVGKDEFRNKFVKRMQQKPFNEFTNRYIFKSYDELMIYYEKKLEIEKIDFFK